MPEAADTQVFLELTQYSLHALRAVNGKIEAGGECVLENKSALEALLDSVAPTRKADGGIRAGTPGPFNVNFITVFTEQAQIDAAAEATVPVVSAVLGSVAGLPAVNACLSHFNVMVRGTSQLFPGGPPVVKAALGLDITKEELGGAALHTQRSGVADNSRLFLPTESKSTVAWAREPSPFVSMTTP